MTRAGIRLTSGAFLVAVAPVPSLAMTLTKHAGATSRASVGNATDDGCGALEAAIGSTVSHMTQALSSIGVARPLARARVRHPTRTYRCATRIPVATRASVVEDVAGGATVLARSTAVDFVNIPQAWAAGLAVAVDTRAVVIANRTVRCGTRQVACRRAHVFCLAYRTESPVPVSRHI